MNIIFSKMFENIRNNEHNIQSYHTEENKTKADLNMMNMKGKKLKSSTTDGGSITLQKWRVIEDNPWPDNYIPIFAPRSVVKPFGSYSEHFSKSQALTRAKQLMRSFQLRRVRFFYADGHSEVIR